MHVLQDTVLKSSNMVARSVAWISRSASLKHACDSIQKANHTSIIPSLPSSAPKCPGSNPRFEHTFLDEDLMGQLKGQTYWHSASTSSWLCGREPESGTYLSSCAGWAKRSGLKRHYSVRGREYGILRIARMRYRSLRWRMPELMAAIKTKSERR